MKTLVLGSTGLLGQAVTAETRRRGWLVVTAARSDAEIALDITNADALVRSLDQIAPDLVVNCAGLTDLARCEQEPGLAYSINARPVAILAEWAGASGGRLLHVSTDHYFPEGGAIRHRESDRVRLINEYARSKFAGEAFALAEPRALVMRTSIVGIRGWSQPTLAEWAIGAVLADAPMMLFADAYTSSIDVGAFARAAFDLAVLPASGLINLAAGEPYSKAQFVTEIAGQLGRRLDKATSGSVAKLQPPRASSLGLDVTQAEVLLGYKMPTLAEVVTAILDDYKKRSGS